MALHRTWVFLINGRLVPEKSYKDPKTGRWLKPKLNLDDLVATIGGSYGDLDIYQIGPKYSDNLRGECIELHRGVTPDNFNPDLWFTVPDKVKQMISHKVKAAENKVTRQHSQISNEELMTGVIFGEVDSEFSADGWNVDIRYVEFSKTRKEPTTGADIAIILDVKDDLGDRAFKSLWFQAKRENKIPKDLAGLPRLEGQLEKMRGFTEESYALVYSPQGVVAARADAPNAHIELDALLEKAMNCKAGDPSSELLGNSMNRKYVLSVMLDKLKRRRF